MEKLPTLKIGDLNINPPFILGGMGVLITTHPLVSAVANEGMAGTIASVGLGGRTVRGKKFVTESNNALAREIRKSREMSDGVIGVNIMCALTNYEDLVRTAVKEKADYIISGAGLPFDLPGYTEGSDIKIIPIVSSSRAAAIVCSKWKMKYDRLPDAIVVEGPKAGGHLGYKQEDLENGTAQSVDDIASEVIELVSKYKNNGIDIPVIIAGGIFDGKDIARALRLGAAGVQMGTRFVATDECAVPDAFKQAYIDSTEEDISILNSPVGMPGRVINNEFVEKVNRGERHPVNCFYHCLKTCKPKEVPFCIAKALLDAAEGNMDEALIFSGSNAHRVNEVVPVKQLVKELKEETLQELNSNTIKPLMSLQKFNSLFIDKVAVI